MSKARSKPAPAPETDADLPTVVAELNERCDHLAQQLRVQNDILEEIRSELQYLVTNGIEIRDAPSFRARIPVLKGMALDPAGDEWGEKLDINHDFERAESAPSIDTPMDETELQAIPVCEATSANEVAQSTSVVESQARNPASDHPSHSLSARLPGRLF